MQVQITKEHRVDFIQSRSHNVPSKIMLLIVSFKSQSLRMHIVDTIIWGDS